MSRPRRLFAAELPKLGGEIPLDDVALRHAKVLRLSAGDQLVLFDGQGHEADATVSELGRTRMRCRVGPARLLPAPDRQLHLIVGAPKGGKLEGIVRMLTELGVSSIHLAQCERSVPRPGEQAGRLTRLSRVALEACAQSGQARAPELHAMVPLCELMPRVGQGIGFVLWESGSTSLQCAIEDSPLSALSAGQGAPAQVWLVVGPEGGLTREEVELLTERGFAEVGLGPGILRVETAVVAGAALLLERLGRLQPA